MTADAPSGSTSAEEIKVDVKEEEIVLPATDALTTAALITFRQVREAGRVVIEAAANRPIAEVARARNAVREPEAT